jgi:ceramide glucosyltransferase
MLDIPTNVLSWLLTGALLAATAGGLAYYLIALFLSIRLRAAQARRPAADDFSPPVSLLKPLCGAEPKLEQCLESFFLQDYPNFEIIFAMRNEADPASLIVERLQNRYPQVAARAIFTGEPPYANAKVYSLQKMTEAARYDLLVITDSDASVEPGYLKSVSREFVSTDVGGVTNLYRGVGGNDLWSELEALGMSTEFMAGVVVAHGLEGMKFMLGPSMAIRRKCLDSIGGFSAMKDYLADDFVLGHWADAAGRKIALSTHVIDHHVSTEGFFRTFKHRVRWNRSTRFSRPAGYVGQGFTYGLCWALLLFLFSQTIWAGGLLLLVGIVRFALAIEIGDRLLRASIGLGRLSMLPLQDLISFASWLQGFLGREVIWRNERYRLLSGGRFEPVEERVDAAILPQSR